jgi:predicted amidohydrolase
VKWAEPGPDLPPLFIHALIAACEDRRMKVAALQSGLRGYDAAALADALARCADQSVDLLVLPECYAGGMPATVDEAAAAAISAPYSALVEMLGDCSPTISVVAGFVERSAPGVLHSSAAVIKAGRVLGVSRKLFPVEPMFTAGDGLPTYAVGDHSFGVVICHDGNFVEPARLLALAGVRVLVCPLNNDLRADVARKWAARTHANLVARAVENDCWVIAADVCGAEDGRVGIGASRVLAPDGRVVAAAPSDEQALLVVDIDIAAVSMLNRWDVKHNPSIFRAWVQAQLKP